jgi:GNAT superfamily N-acetyltransferase
MTGPPMRRSAGGQYDVMTGADEAALAGRPVITRVGEDDWRVWREVRLAALTDAPTAFGSGLERKEALPEDAWRAMARTAAIFVAVADGAAVGVVAGLPRASAEERGLGAMWVAPSWRGRGVAPALAAAVMAWARSEGGARIRLWVPADSARALRFYESQGFRATGQARPFPDDDTRVIHEMLIELARAEI